jgi:ABC-type transport system substrate-binding protein
MQQAKAQEENYFFEFTLIAPLGYEPRMKTAEVLKEEYPKIGIKVNIEYMDWAQIYIQWEKMNTVAATFAEGGVDTFMCASGAGNDPTGLDRHVHSDHVNWPTRWSNTRLDELLDIGGKTFAMEERKPIYQEATRILTDEKPIMTIWWMEIPYVHDKSIKNLDMRYDITYGYRNMTIEGKTEADDTTVIYAQPTGVRGLSMAFPYSDYDRRHINIVYDALIYQTYTFLDPEVQGPVPALAESWDISDDYLTFTLYLKQGVKWHDGVEFTSEDVKCLADGAMDPDTGHLQHIRWATYVESVEVLDKYTVVFHMKEPYPGIWEEIFFRGRICMPAHIMKDVPHGEWATHELHVSNPIGTGPYKFVQYVKDEFIEFEAFDDYWGGRPFVDRVFFQIMPEASAALIAAEKKEVQILEGWYGYTKELLELPDHLTYQGSPSLTGWQAMYFNTNHPILGNKYVRDAICFATPRQHIIDDLTFGMGTAATQFIRPEIWWSDDNYPDPWTYDIDKAKGFMEMAGYNYDWLEPPEPVSMTTYLLPAVVGLIAGNVIGAVIVYWRKR